MSLRTVGERPRHNPRQLPCHFASCRRWFRNQSGLTKHIRSFHHDSGQAPSRLQRSPPANANEAQNSLRLPIHRSSSQGNRDPASLSTPSAGSRADAAESSPASALPPENNDVGASIQLPHHDGLFPPVLHPLINGLYFLISEFLSTKSFPRAPL